MNMLADHVASKINLAIADILNDFPGIRVTGIIIDMQGIDSMNMATEYSIIGTHINIAYLDAKGDLWNGEGSSQTSIKRPF